MVRVFEFGGRPTLWNGAIRAQIKLGRVALYNMLTEGENERRQQAWGGEHPSPPHDECGCEKCKAYREERERTNDRRKPKPPHETCRCEECRAYWKKIGDAYFATKPVDVIPYRTAAVEKGLYWGTYLMVEQAFSAAWKDRKYYYPVRFRSWRDGGVMGVRIQADAKPENFFRITKIQDNRVGKRRGQRHAVCVRVGSDALGNPIWSDPISFEMHRPIQGRVKQVQICLSFRGDREIWSVNITCVDVPEREDNANSGQVAIDVGWRLLPNGEMRIAFATAHDGSESELTLPARWCERSLRADRIRSHRDKRLNTLKESDPRFTILKSPRSVRLYARKNGIVGEFIEKWVKRERHLEEYELGCRRKTTEARRDKVRVWLRMLRRKYSVAIRKDSGHKKMKEQAKEDGMTQAARRQGHICAPGETIEEIDKVFGRNTGVAVIKTPGTTATCLKCKNENEVGPELMVKCERCGTTEDRDRISTRNLLARYFAGEAEKPTPRKATARFAKRHKKNDAE